MAQTGQQPWLYPGWKILPTRLGYCSNTNCARHFRYEDNNVAFMPVQPHHYRVRQVEPCHQLGEVARRSSLAFTLLALCPNNNNNNNHTHAQPILRRRIKLSLPVIRKQYFNLGGGRAMVGEVARRTNQCVTNYTTWVLT